MAYDMEKVIRDARRRRVKALRLRRKGLTIQAIADEFGVTKPRMSEILARAEREAAAEARRARRGHYIHLPAKQRRAA